MKPIPKAIIVFLAATSTSFAGWIASVHPEHQLYPGGASVTYSTNTPDGHVTFAGALKQLAAEGHLRRLKWVSLHPFIHDGDFQRELFSILERSSPKALQAALQVSGPSGNGNNPKIGKLYQPFMEAVLVTSAVKKIAVELATHDLRITGASGEKFMLIKDKGGRRFSCSLVLDIERIAEPNGPANGSQPVRSETNQTSSAAGSRR